MYASASTSFIVLLHLKIFCMNTESFTTRASYKKIEIFNKTITNVAAEHTNILYIQFVILFAQPKTMENILDICIVYHFFLNS